jgi:hypothetical protein
MTVTTLSLATANLLPAAAAGCHQVRLINGSRVRAEIGR